MLNNILEIFGFALPLVITILFARSIFFWLNFIQIKQYRVDRIWFSLKTLSFWKLLLSPYRYLLYALIIIWEVLFRFKIITNFELVFGLSLLVFYLFAIQSLIQLARKKLQLPKMTFKIWVLFMVMLGVEVIISIPYFFYPEQMILIEVLQPFIVFILFGIFFLPNVIQQKRYKKLAAIKRSGFENLKVIGITGSYGKTMMKEYLDYLLSSKFKTLKTPSHINVDTGIAKLVLDKLDKSTEIFIVEMGAYKKGEIKSSCNIVKPTHGIMTGLGTQHLELFGSEDNIENAKFELVEAVGNDATIFANKHSEKLESAFKKRNKFPNWYGEGGDLAVTVSKPSRAQKITLDGAIKVAQKLGVTTREIQILVDKGLPEIEGTMVMKKGKNSSFIIDDTFNASTEAILVALEDLSDSKRSKKIFVFKDMIELGSKAKVEHIKIAKAAANSATHIVLLSSKFSPMMKEVIIAEGFNPESLYSEADIDRLDPIIDQQAIILFEGRDAHKMIKKFV